jgi:hypothetical protein
MDAKTRLMYRVVAWVSGVTAFAVVVYGIVASIAQTGGPLVVGQVLVNVDWPFPPYFAKPISYFGIASVAFFYSELRLWEERIMKWPPYVLSALQLVGFVVAFASAYEVMYNFMLWGAVYSFEAVTRNLTNPDFLTTPFSIPWSFVFATRAFSALFVVSGYSVYFLRRVRNEPLI